MTIQAAIEPRVIYGTSSTRRAHSRSKRYRWVPSIDRRDLVGTPWEIKNNEALYFTNHPSPDGSLFVILRRYYAASGPVISHSTLPKGVHVANLQEGHRVRFWTDLAYFLHMEGDTETIIKLMPNGELHIFYPPRLTTGSKTVDALMHKKAKPEKKEPQLIKETIRETTREYK